ncbi:phage tail protein (plasmid) [Raoultella ornithinolytica]|uniref:phage tail protein n=1 Tax=Raoultella ornithinolytica TaxID=54291 RepID=UPI00292ACCB4|nr:phage tail protein [Raoultella ornithinolytica]MDV1094956.1 phage tail protein [Raoultella ornithinolytica]MDV1122700.1 phage tail protein [Raoultella ornithinolytica]MDV1893215.1 phage tail protein [Raoultella ornithinolytica]
MGIFSGVGNALTGALSFNTKSFTSNLISDILDKALSSGTVSGAYASDIAYGKNIIAAAMRIRYAQGWQWTVEVDGLSGFDMFVKDITYGRGNIETENKTIGSVEFSKPTHVTAGPITMTVRDTEDGKVMSWFEGRKARVTNRDGTLNLPSSYLMKIRLYRVMQDGGKSLEEEMTVFPTLLGEVTRSRDQVTEFLSFPITFQRYTTAGSGLGGLASGAVGAATGIVKDMASSVIKF